MINLKDIRTYMYCPRKMYLQNSLNQKFQKNYQINTELRELRIDIQDIIHRNLRMLKKEMNCKEIKEELYKNINHYVKYTFDNIRYLSIESEEVINEIYEDMEKEIEYKINAISLKVKQLMDLHKKDGIDVSNFFYPSSVYNYLIKDNYLNIIGNIDKIEINNNKYIPISYKSSIPPLKGVSESDAVELVGKAMLVESEFDTEVFVGFIEYVKINERRAVVMDVEIRKELFKVLSEMKNILLEEKIPPIEVEEKKCEKCEYIKICNENLKS